MSTIEENPTALAVVETASPLITIEPAKYVALVFEPFKTRLAKAKVLAEAAEFDADTTAGMAVAVRHRATFRDIRVDSEKARKIRKAPILEIGKLLDGGQKEIETEIEPYESRFDDAIKASEKRKDDEKIAKALAESKRITEIRQKIDAMRNTPQQWINKPSVDIGAAADHLSETAISLDAFQEFTGEAISERDNAVKQLRTMQEAMRQHEEAQAELVRKQAELAEQERLAGIERAEQAERDRVAAEERAAQERKDAAARAAEVAEQQAANERAAAAMQAERAAHDERVAKELADIKRQQDAIDEEKQRVADEAAARQRAIEAAEQAKRDEAAAVELAKQEEADRLAREEAARVQAANDAAEAAELAQRLAAEAEAERRERVQFELNGPEASEMVAVLAAHYEVEQETVLNWADVEIAA
jgi:hypothetical protein